MSCLVGVLLLLAIGCASQLPQDDVLSQPPGGPALSMIVSNSDLAVGENRLSFGLVDRDYMPWNFGELPGWGLVVAGDRLCESAAPGRCFEPAAGWTRVEHDRVQ